MASPTPCTVNCRSFSSTSSVAHLASRTGFTLVELLVVLLITALLAMLAVPSFTYFSESASVARGQTSLRGALELARSEAIARSTRVGLCRSLNANEANPSCSDAAVGALGALDWAAGWILYAKGAGNAGNQLQAGDTLLQRQPPFASVDQRGRVALWAPAAGAVLYDWNGLRATGLQGSFLIDHGAGSRSRPTAAASRQAMCLMINAAGRLDVVPPAAGACP